MKPNKTMKLTSVSALMLLAVFVMSSVAHAVPYTIVNYAASGTYTYSNSGSYLGTVIGENDSLDVVEGVLNQLGYSVDLTSFGKVNAPGLASDEGDIELYVTYADDGHSGQWATYNPVTPAIPAGAALIDFYVVKGGDDFALYLVDPAQAYGTWNTENLDRNRNGITRSISHFSGYAVFHSVPEPGTMLLLGFGLVGLAGLRGRK